MVACKKGEGMTTDYVRVPARARQRRGFHVDWRRVFLAAIVLSIPFWMLGAIALIAAWLSGKMP
jgi:hypothetical protein